MPPVPFTSSVEDSVPKVSNELAVGEDLKFQRRWWRFERIVWSFFLLLLICDLLGLFGRGWLANAHAQTSDQALVLDYERFARASTPSVMTLHFGPGAIHDGHIHLYVSDDLVKPLGAQRISPQPATSAVGEGGILYTFDATQAPAVVQIALEPSFPGLHGFQITLAGHDPIQKSIFVVP